MVHTSNPYLYSKTKRSLDITIASAAMPAYAVGLTAATAIELDSPTTVHDRVAADGTEFTIKKINIDRFKKLGSKLVALGLDELPQFVNIWQGSMSLVGPRALLEETRDAFLSSLNPTLRHAWLDSLTGVKPGLISTYALAEHSAMTDRDRAVMDMYDAQHASLRHDLFLLRHLGRMPTQAVVVALEEETDTSIAQEDELVVEKEAELRAALLDTESPDAEEVA